MELPEVKPQYPDLSVDEKIIAKTQLLHAPQPALTTAAGGSLTSGGSNNLKSADATILTNAVQRILDIETALKKLGFIK